MKAVIFDLDGTLLDVREAFFYQFEALSEQFDGKPASREAIVAAAHGTTEEIVRTLIKNQEVPFEAICQRHIELRLEAYDRFLKLYAGVDELLPILKRMGIKVAALTAGNHLTVSCLERMGIHHHFDAIITAADVTQVKPHPEGLYRICAQLGVAPADTMMVGDSVVDMLVGKNAQVGKVVGVSHGFGRIEALRAAGADHLIDDIPTLLDILWSPMAPASQQVVTAELSLASATV